MEFTPERVAYQLLRNESSLFDNQTFSESVKEQIGSDQERQHKCCSVYKSPGRDKIDQSLSVNVGIMADGHSEQHGFEGSPYHWQEQCSSRSVESHQNTSNRVDFKQDNCWSNFSSVGCSSDGPFCFMGEQANRSILNFKAGGFWESARNLLNASWRKGTQQDYIAKFEKYSSWCTGKQIDPYSAILSQIAFLFESGLQYRTISGYRSMLSPIDNYLVGQHPYISSDLQSLRIDKASMKVQEKGITFIRHGLSKQDRQSHFGEKIHVPHFPERELLDPKRSIIIYLNKTKNIRQKLEASDKVKLFLAMKEPHKPVTSVTISSWIVQTIRSAYSNDNLKVKGHSTRAIAPSWALYKGAWTKSILDAADWSSESTFVRFYLRDLDSCKVLQ
ncbi:unnamed protein product [Mytilus coruscus]|uniref:Core-binding (CB) domain-containing protein n=1 Tax=Mytilus coruscus TaxID=42192 RepID=A0A6J8CAK0_MYTCO|nr:unnamed protein product [Mytilus coruscus]